MHTKHTMLPAHSLVMTTGERQMKNISTTSTARSDETGMNRECIDSSFPFPLINASLFFSQFVSSPSPSIIVPHSVIKEKRTKYHSERRFFLTFLENVTMLSFHFFYIAIDFSFWVCNCHQMNQHSSSLIWRSHPEWNPSCHLDCTCNLKNNYILLYLNILCNL